MDRRIFIHHFVLGTVTLTLMPSFSKSKFRNDNERWCRILVSGINAPKVVFPKEKRVPLGWKAFPVAALTGHGGTTILRFPQVEIDSSSIWLRITSAIDIREEVMLEVFLPETSDTIATLDIKYAHPFQPFEAMIEGRWLSGIIKQGVGLRMTKGAHDAWFYHADATRNDNLGLQPQLLAGAFPGTKADIFENLYSMNSFSPFGWMGGCVLDALLELSRNGDQKAMETLRKQLSYFLDDEKGIIFENPMTVPLDGAFNSIEDFLPFAAIASLYPDHLSVQKAVDYCLERMKPNGLIASGDHVTTEGCYTMAYPLAQIAIIRNDRSLASIALDQLVHRIHYLSTNEAIFQRNDLGKGTGFRNWGRGIVWYVLGIVKTIHLLEGSSFDDLPQIVEVKAEFVRAMNWASQFQDKDGMFCSFIDRPETLPDTTATAGIATAMAWGVRLKLLPESYREKAKFAGVGLHQYVTADGFLTNVSQINRGGEALQGNGYRAISQFALGLMVQYLEVADRTI